jgi:hypothetical protein
MAQVATLRRDGDVPLRTTVGRPVGVSTGRFAAKPRQMRVTWRPKGPF